MLKENFSEKKVVNMAGVYKNHFTETDFSYWFSYRHSKTEEIHQSKYSLQLQNLSVNFTKKIVFACMTSLNSAGSDGRYSRHGMVPRPEVYVLAKA